MYNKKYDSSDVDQILKNTGAKSWNELSDFIREKGESVWHVTKEEADQMARDVESLAQKREEFTQNPNQMYAMLKKHDHSQYYDLTGEKGGISHRVKEALGLSDEEDEEERNSEPKDLWSKLFNW